MKYILQVNDVSFAYKDKVILDKCTINLKQGVFYSIVGESGSGKTTFLSLIGGLEMPKSGKIIYNGKEVNRKNLLNYRKKAISFVFQEYNLIPYMTPYENVLLAMQVHDNHVDGLKAHKALEEVGLTKDKIYRKVTSLSGGERQRVAIARAIFTAAPIILADEPTGNLDDETSFKIIDLFKKLAHEYNKCVVVVTHDKALADDADVVVRLNINTKHFELVKYERS